MEVLSVKKYNAMMYKSWRAKCDELLSGGSEACTLPSLGMWLFEKRYGYIAYSDNRAVWGRLRRDAVREYERVYN